MSLKSFEIKNHIQSYHSNKSFLSIFGVSYFLEKKECYLFLLYVVSQQKRGFAKDPIHTQNETKPDIANYYYLSNHFY